MKGTVVESAVNTFTEAPINVPNLAEAGFVMEILKIWMENTHNAPTSIDAGDHVAAALYDRPATALPRLADPGVIITQRHHGGSGATTGMYQTVWEYDFTDGDGNGLLYGKKQLFLGVLGLSLGVVGRADVSILYRLKKVKIEELVGLVQD